MERRWRSWWASVPGACVALALGCAAEEGAGVREERAAVQLAWPDLMAPGPRVDEGGAQDAAVVVGIEDYWQVADVPGAAENALLWSRWLSRDRGVPLGRIVLLTNADGTRERIEQALEQAAAQVGQGGRLWFVFIGHGAASAEGGDGVLIGADVQQNAASIYARSVSRQQVLDVLERARVPRAVVVLDTCFSGRSRSGEGLAAGLQPLIPAKEVAPARGVTVLTAGRSDQLAGPLPGADRPAFSYLLLGALRGWADADHDGAVSEQEALDYVTESLRFLLAGNRDQLPELTSEDAARPLVQGAELEVGPDIFELAATLRRGAPRTPIASAAPVLAQGEARPMPGMVQVPAGWFLQGSAAGDPVEGPERTVQLDAFWIDATEVSVDAWAACVAAGRCAEPDTTGPACSGEHAWANNWLHREERGQHPINCVTWLQARDYCAFAGKRLPTEAEWEKAARGVDGRPFPWGTAPPLETGLRYGNFADASARRLHPDWNVLDGYDDGFTGTAPVGSFPEGASPSGALDMAGNVWEWVADWYAPDSYADMVGQNPTGPATGTLRVNRGASFDYSALAWLRVTWREGNAPDEAYVGVGFRCAR